MDTPLCVLIGVTEPDFLEQVRGVSERIRLISRQQLEDRPGLLQELEVAYGGLSREQMARASRLRWIQTGGAGVNGLVTAELAQGDLIITNASGIHAEPIAEHMFGQLLMVTRRLAEAWDQQKTRRWKGYDFGARVGLLAGKTLGVLGVGAIGGQCALVGRAFGMQVLGLRRSGAPHPGVERMFSPDQRLEFFSECDVVMNSLPLTERTRRFMSWAEFGALPGGAIVANSGRGGTVDTHALTAALREGTLAAALLDVTDPEPLPEEHPLWSMEGAFITPHYAGSHPGYNQRAGTIFLDNLRRFLAGEPLRNVVDKREGY